MKSKKIRKAEPISAPNWYRRKQKSDFAKKKKASQEFETMIKKNLFMR